MDTSPSKSFMSKFRGEKSKNPHVDSPDEFKKRDKKKKNPGILALMNEKGSIKPLGRDKK